MTVVVSEKGTGCVMALHVRDLPLYDYREALRPPTRFLPVEVIHMLGRQGAIFHAHMKDTVLYKDKVAKYGVLNFVFEKQDLKQASDAFRAVGYGHSATLWKDVVRAYMDVGFDGMLSVENEDPILSGEVGVERALWVLKNVREELLTEQIA